MRISDIPIRDPFVVPVEGRYYLFGSTDKDIWKGPGQGFDGYVSHEGSLKDFQGPFPAFRPPENFWSETNFWAPEVHWYRGSWYMFATFKPQTGRRGTAILKSSDGLLGPYLPWSWAAPGVSGPVSPGDWECLDGTFFMEQGIPYLVFCHEWQQVGDGEICALPLTEDLRQAAGAPVLLFRASEAPWTGELAGRAPGSYVTDGPFMYPAQGGGLLMLWSSFNKAGNYCLGLARSASGTLSGPWFQEQTPLYQGDGGHGMLFRGWDGILYLALHTPNQTPWERACFIPVQEALMRLAITGGDLPQRT
ncbi:MAG: glycoside hydrolase family 43 protein [Spirochaetaceae bacterium]|jgi:GH43 family beta-xylosidase|nr:glycoside hydrolase family 43 protein [Spirochaetaceae bacterium]